ncbi:MAG: nucleoside-diphosphate kinase [Bacteroidota bacterium]
MAGFTFALIKPDAVHRKQVGEVITMIEQAGFTIQAMRLAQLTPAIAGVLYKAHKGRSYYEPMCAFIASGPIVAMVLEKENAVSEFDQLKDIIRQRFTTSRTHNAIHGADTIEAARREIALFFPACRGLSHGKNVFLGLAKS